MYVKTLDASLTALGKFAKRYHQLLDKPTMAFKATFCDPIVKDIIELGIVSKGQIIDTFNGIDWDKHLNSIKNVSGDKIFYSPSFEIENLDNENGLAISAVGDAGNYEFNVFYKRPKTVKKLFGLTSKFDKDYLTDIQGQNKSDVIKFLTALIKNDLDLLDREIK